MLPLSLEPVPFIVAVEDLVDLAAQVRTHIEGGPAPAGLPYPSQGKQHANS